MLGVVEQALAQIDLLVELLDHGVRQVKQHAERVLRPGWPNKDRRHAEWADWDAERTERILDDEPG